MLVAARDLSSNIDTCVVDMTLASRRWNAQRQPCVGWKTSSAVKASVLIYELSRQFRLEFRRDQQFDVVSDCSQEG